MKKFWNNPIFVFFIIWALTSICVVAWGIWENICNALARGGKFYGI